MKNKKEMSSEIEDVKLKSELYNHDSELIEKRDTEEDYSDAIMWGFVLGFILFFILLIVIIVFTNR